MNNTILIAGAASLYSSPPSSGGGMSSQVESCGLEAQAEALFARIRSLRGDDTLEPLVTDSRNFVHEECARRRSA